MPCSVSNSWFVLIAWVWSSSMRSSFSLSSSSIRMHCWSSVRSSYARGSMLISCWSFTHCLRCSVCVSLFIVLVCCRICESDVVSSQLYSLFTASPGGDLASSFNVVGEERDTTTLFTTAKTQILP